jgi:hypothetical protein
MRKKEKNRLISRVIFPKMFSIPAGEEITKLTDKFLVRIQWFENAID